MEFTDLENLIRSRRSIRSWQDNEVPQELLLQAIELATWAPNGGNRQNWRFYLILNRKTIQTIADEVQASTNKITSWSGVDKYMDTRRMRDRAAFFRGAPAAIALAASQYQSPIDQFLTARGETDSKARTIKQWRNIAHQSRWNPRPANNKGQLPPPLSGCLHPRRRLPFLHP